MSGSHDAEGIPFPSHGLSLADQRKALELQTAERIAALLKEREDLERTRTCGSRLSLRS